MKYYRLYIFLASNEWGNELMQRVAEEQFLLRAERPLIITVHEHAGWFLSFIKDGTVVGTANDSAVLSGRAVSFWNECRDGEEIHLGEIRRPDKTTASPAA